MSKILLTCEKPDVAKMIASVVDCSTANKGGFFESDEYVITWGFGHMIENKMPDEINPDLKKWELEPLPIFFDYRKDQKVAEGKLKQLNIVKKLINRPDIDMIINCGDADREGLLIQEEMYAFSGCKKPIKILWADGLSKDSVIKCLNNLHDREEFIGLLDAGRARNITDWLCGMNYSRGLKLTLYPYSMDRIAYGRCQTPVLKLMVDRELEIKNFKVEDYFEIEGIFDKGYIGLLIDKDKEVVKFKTNDEANSFVNGIKNNKGSIVDYKVEKKSKKAPNLFSLLTLQKQMSGLMSANDTLEHLQKLYEKGIVSYPRTDAEYIDEGTYNELEKRLIPAISHFKIDRKTLSSFEKIKKDIVKPKKVASHFAILPTEKGISKEQFNKLDKKEQILLETIYKRLIALLMPDYEYETIEIITSVDNNLFKTTGTNPIKLGWKELYVKDEAEKEKDKDDDEKEDESVVPTGLKKGDNVVCEKFDILSKKTEPPKRYTTSSLLSLMKKHGIGRPSTYADIIEKLQHHKFIMLKSKNYYCSDLAIDYMKKIPPVLVDTELTKKFEERLDKIADKELSLDSFLKDFEDEQKEMIKFLKSNMSNVPKYEGKKCEYKCPICQKPLKDMKFSYNCECGFKLSKQVAGKDLSDKNINDLLTKGKTGLIKGLKKKAGGTFDACVVLGKDGKTSFEFLKSKK